MSYDSSRGPPGGAHLRVAQIARLQKAKLQNFSWIVTVMFLRGAYNPVKHEFESEAASNIKNDPFHQQQVSAVDISG